MSLGLVETILGPVKVRRVGMTAKTGLSALLVRCCSIQSVGQGEFGLGPRPR